MVLLAALLTLAVSGAAPAQPQLIDIEAPGPNGALKGTLAGPMAPDRPVVLIIPSSGSTDRDGNNPLGVRAAPYRLLASGLADRRIGGSPAFGSTKEVCSQVLQPAPTRTL
ncbi:MAG TPA: hypothetical protein VIG90_02645 [Pedomonas sp.]|uniref:hypothetical protein n=1 Tax=Pedomonas sp. TaxID=2976421 RepID=UPI002F3F711D